MAAGYRFSADNGKRKSRGEFRDTRAASGQPELSIDREYPGRLAARNLGQFAGEEEKGGKGLPAILPRARSPSSFAGSFRTAERNSRCLTSPRSDLIRFSTMFKGNVVRNPREFFLSLPSSKTSKRVCHANA